MRMRREGIARATRAKTSTHRDALDGAEVGEVDEEASSGWAKRGAHGGERFVRDWRVDVAVDEVGDDFDLAGDAEVATVSSFEVAGDGGDAVAFLDGERVMGR